MAALRWGFLALFAACLSGGCTSGAGSSGKPPASPSSAQSDAQTEAEAVLESVCSKLDSCFPSLSFSDCEAGIRRSAALFPGLGLSPGAFASYDDVITAEQSGNITASDSAASACIAGIGALACESTPVRLSFDPSNPTDFTSVGNLLPTLAGSCPDLY